jgi:hypothetical protein
MRLNNFKQCNFYALLFLLVILSSIFLSCNNNYLLSTLQTEELFSIPLGTMEDQFNFFINNRAPFMGINKLYLDDRLFYIVNGNAAKIMQYSPFGYMMLLIYNPQINSAPILLEKDKPTENKEISNRQATEYPFNYIGAIAVDNQKNIYIEDQLPESQYILEDGIKYTNIIRVFSPKGEIKRTKKNNEYTIGKEGVGLSPFPYIDNIYITLNNELVVVSRTTTAWLIYWFDNTHKPLYEVEIDFSHIPIPKDSNYIPTLEKIIPDYHNPILYVMVSYSEKIVDELTNTVAKVKNIESRIFKLDITSGKYDANSFIVPNEETSEVGFFEEKKIPDISLYEFLGVNESGCFFFIKMKDTTTYILQILNSKGKLLKKLKFQIDDRDLMFIFFNLSKKGILSAIIIETSQVRVVWWRSDKIIEQTGNEGS